MLSETQNTTDERHTDVGPSPAPVNTFRGVIDRCQRTWGRIPPRWTFIGGLFITAKVMLTLAGLLIIRAQAGVSRNLGYFEAAKHNATSHRSLSMWLVWDSFRYLGIAQKTFFAHGGEGDSRFAFPPLYPLLGRAFANVVAGRTALALLLVSNVAFLLMLYYAYRLGERLFGDEDTARRFTKYLVLLPAGFIFQAAMTESLFLCLVLASFYYAERRKWLLAGILGFFFALTRSYGFLGAIPLALILLDQDRYRLHPRALWGYVKTGWPLALIPMGWLTFMAYCRLESGDWFRYQHEQERGWHITMQNPLRPLWDGLVNSEGTASTTWLAALFLVLAVVSLKYLKPAYAVFAVLMILMPLSAGPSVYQSLVRYLVIIFPVALVFAVWGKRRAINTYLTTGLGLLQGAMFALWLSYWTMFII